MNKATAWAIKQIDRIKPWLNQATFNEISLAEKRQLRKSLFDDVMEKPISVQCFIAGTPIWTDRGPVPIEQIKVGDLVLSKCEHTGEQAYKRVTRTFKREKQIVYPLSYAVEAEDGKRYCEMIFCTKEHPFWERDDGWMTCDELLNSKFSPTYEKMHPIGETKDGKEATIGVKGLHITYPVIAQIGPADRGLVHIGYGDGEPMFTEYIFDGKRCDGHFDPIAWKYDPENIFRTVHGATIYDANFTLLEEHIPDYPLNEEQPMRLDVYNIEVEDFHTYYVGNLGLWAHNACDIRNHLNKLTIQFADAARSVQEALSFKTLWSKY